jgi:hypothetical protein
LRHLSQARPSPEQIDQLLADAETVVEVWGDVVPAATRRYAVTMCHRRLSVGGLLRSRVQAPA